MLEFEPPSADHLTRYPFISFPFGRADIPAGVNHEFEDFISYLTSKLSRLSGDSIHFEFDENLSLCYENNSGNETQSILLRSPKDHFKLFRYCLTRLGIDDELPEWQAVVSLDEINQTLIQTRQKLRLGSNDVTDCLINIKVKAMPSFVRIDDLCQFEKLKTWIRHKFEQGKLFPAMIRFSHGRQDQN